MTVRTRTQYSLINTFTSLGGYSLNIICSFICRMFFVRYLNAEYLGINGMFSNVLSMLSLAELGIGTAMTYALYKPISDKDEKKQAAFMTLYGSAYKIIGIIIFGIGILLIPFLDVLVGTPYEITENITMLYLLYLFSTASSYFFSYKSAIIIAHQKNYIVLGISYIFVIIQNVLQILILIFSHNYTLYLVIQILCIFLSNIFISKSADKNYSYINKYTDEKLSKNEVLTLFKNVKALTITKLSGILVNNTDNIVITYFNGLIVTGIVSNYSLLVSTLNSLTNQIFSGLSSSLGNLNAESDQERKYSIFKALNLSNFWVYAWASVGIFVLSNDLIEFFFGNEYLLGLEIPLILMINFYMLGMQTVVGMYKSTMGLFRYGQYVLLITAILNLMGDFVLGYSFGLLGIYTATALARLFTNTWYEPYVIYKYGFNRKFSEYIKRYLFFIFVLIVALLSSYYLCSFITLSILPRLIIRFIICIIIPNFVFILFFRNWPEFKYLFNVINFILNRFRIKFIKS